MIRPRCLISSVCVRISSKHPKDMPEAALCQTVPTVLC